MYVLDSDQEPAAGTWSEPGTGPYRAEFFGPFRVTCNDVPLGQPAWPRAGARKLLQWFLLNPGQAHSSAELCDVLWPGRTGATRSKQLHVTLHCLRQSLEPGPRRRQPSTFIRADGQGTYWFDPAGSWWTDLLAVEQLLRAADSARSTGDSGAAIGHYQQVARYYEQTFLPEDIYEDAFTAHRAAHDLRHLEVLHSLLDLYLGNGLDFEAVQCASTLLDHDPYSEPAVMAIAQVSLHQGNHARAENELDRFIRTIESDLAAIPSRPLLELRSRTRRAA